MGGFCDFKTAEEPDKTDVQISMLDKRATIQSEVLIDNQILVKEANGNLNENYIIEKAIGEGSYGKVYLVKHRQTGIERAMKETIIDSQTNIEEIKNEIEILKKLDHPNIVKIYEFYVNHDRLKVLTEYCRYGELFDEINKQKKFSENHTATIIHQLLLSIYYCHINNIIHRDLKPENILIDGKDNNGHLIIKVIDFGTAKIFKTNEFEKKFIGSIYYIAPEVINKNYNEKCDLWSCGIIMYILLNGSPPFNGNTDQDILNSIKNKDLDSRVLNTFSADAKDLISKFLNKDYKKRISAAEALDHPFFKKIKNMDQKLGNEKISLFINNLKSYKPDYKLQQAAIALIVHNMPHNQEIKELEKAFRLIDENGDGKLTKEEIIKGFVKFINKSLDEAIIEVDSIFLAVDADKSGFIEYEEFIRACITKETLLTDTYLRFAFKFFDKDQSGYITVGEIKDVFSGGNKNYSDKTIENMIKDIDTDKDGKVSYEEFKYMMNKIII